MSSMTASFRRGARAVARPVALLALLLPAVAAAQDFEFEDEPAKRTVGFQLGAQSAFGDLKDFTERGLGFGILARQPVKGSRTLSLRADLGFSRFAQSRTASGSAAGGTSFDNQLTVFSALVGGQVTADNETFRPYLHAGAGVGIAQSSLTPTGPNLVSASTSGVGLAWMGGAGVYRLIGESDREWALDIGVKVMGMPGIDLPTVVPPRVNATAFTQGTRSVTSAAWSFTIGLHFIP